MSLGHHEIAEIIALFATLPVGPYLAGSDAERSAVVAKWAPGEDLDAFEDLRAFVSAPRELPFPGGEIFWRVHIANGNDDHLRSGIECDIGDTEEFMRALDGIIKRQVKDIWDVHRRRVDPASFQLLSVILYNVPPPGHFSRVYPLVDSVPPPLVSNGGFYSLGVVNDAFDVGAGYLFAAISRNCALVDDNGMYRTRYAFRVLRATPGEPTQYIRFAVGDMILDDLPLGRAIEVLIGKRGSEFSVTVFTDTHAVRLTPSPRDDNVWNVESRPYDLRPTAVYRVGGLFLVFRTCGGPYGELSLYDFGADKVVANLEDVYVPGRPSVIGGDVYVPSWWDGAFRMMRVARVEGRRIVKLDRGERVHEPIAPTPSPRLVEVEGSIGWQDGDRIVFADGATPAHRVPGQLPGDHYKLTYDRGWYAGGTGDHGIAYWRAKNADP